MTTILETHRSLQTETQRADTLEKDLNEDISSARNTAMRDGKHGVLVIRNAPDCYTVSVSPEVPYGFTYELDQWIR